MLCNGRLYALGRQTHADIDGDAGCLHDPAVQTRVDSGVALGHAADTKERGEERGGRERGKREGKMGKREEERRGKVGKEKINVQRWHPEQVVNMEENRG